MWSTMTIDGHCFRGIVAAMVLKSYYILVDDVTHHVRLVWKNIFTFTIRTGIKNEL